MKNRLDFIMQGPAFSFCKLLLFLLLLIHLPIAAARAQTGRSFTVNTLSDEADPNAGQTGDDGRCDVDPNTPGDQCTFRAAIQNHNANRHLDHNTILFSIPNAPGAPATANNIILIGSSGLGSLPAVLGSVTIDGINHASAGNARIEIDGSQAGDSAIGLQLLGGKDVVSSLVIVHFPSHGIFIAGTPAPGEGGHMLQTLYIGTDQAGTADKGNGGDGLFIDNTPGNAIGGTGLLGNVISANKGYGIRILGRDPSETGQPDGAHDNHIIGNIIGEDLTGSKELANEQGGILNLNAPNNTIGGVSPGQGNRVMGVQAGIWIDGILSKGISILGNTVGKTGTIAKFTNGILTQGGEQLSVQGNIITNIGAEGIYILLDASGSYDIIKNRIISATTMSVFIRVNPNMDIDTMQINYSNNFSSGGNYGLSITEYPFSTINWQLTSDTAINSLTGGHIEFNSSGTKNFNNNQWKANTYTGLRLFCQAAPQMQVNINGDVYAQNGEGLICGVGLEKHAAFIINMLQLTSIENGGNGINIDLGAGDTARCDLFLGGGSQLSDNGGAALRIQGGQPGIDFFNVSLQGLDVRGNKDARAACQLSNVKLNGFAHSSLAGNTGSAIFLGGASYGNIDSNTITGNKGNGIEITDSANASITHNIISENATGIMLYYFSPSAHISANSIFNNQYLGIDEHFGGPSPNEPNDFFADNYPNYPVLRLVEVTGENTIIQGSLNSKPNSSFNLEFFANTAVDPSGYGEGQTFLDSLRVSTDSSGNVSFTKTLAGIALAPGTMVSATSTTSNNHTSEFCFSAPIGIVQLADLELAITANTTRVVIDSPVTFTVLLTNKGPADATDVTVEIDENLSYKEATVTNGYYNGAGWWIIDTIKAGEQATLSLVAEAIRTAPGVYIDRTAVIASNLPDPDSKVSFSYYPDEDDQDSIIITVVPHQPTVEEQILQLGLKVNTLVASGDLTRQQADVLNALLGAALRFYRDGNIKASIGSLQVFSGTVGIFTRIRNFPPFIRRLPKAKGKILISSAEEIIQQLKDLARPQKSPVMENGRVPELVYDGKGIRQFGAYPNPFRNGTNIIMELPKASKARLTVFDLHGRIIAQLLNSSLTAGRHTINWQPVNLPAGVYLLRLETDIGSNALKLIYTE